MKGRRKLFPGLLFAILGFVFQGSTGFACEINDKFSIGGVLAGICRYQSITDAPDYESEGSGLLAFQPTIGFTPTGDDEFFAKGTGRK